MRVQCEHSEEWPCFFEESEGAFCALMLVNIFLLACVQREHANEDAQCGRGRGLGCESSQSEGVSCAQGRKKVI